MSNDICKIRLKLNQTKAIKLHIDQTKSGGSGIVDGVVSVDKDTNGINVLYSDGSNKVINLVHTKEGKLVDENGNELLPGPIKIVVLGDSEL